MFLKIGTKSIGAIVKTGALANIGAFAKIGALANIGAIANMGAIANIGAMLKIGVFANIGAIEKIGAMLKIGASGCAFHLSIPGVEMTPPHVIWLKMIKKTDRCCYISSPFSTLAPLLILSLAVRKCTTV